MSLPGRERSVGPEAFDRLRDRLAHRGPDGAGSWHDAQASLGHRLLAIADPGHGTQPWIVGPRDRPELVLVYNGELYDTRALRRALTAAGRRPVTLCDTELVALALAEWGPPALRRLRGMYAIAAWRPDERSLLLARDPLGIKPLYYAPVATPQGSEVVFGSEIPAVLAHPHVPVRPDWVTVSAYLSTIRTTLDERTLYDGVRTLRPGESLELDCATDAPRALHVHRSPFVDVVPEIGPAIPETDAVRLVRETVDASLEAHLAGDRPIAAMLSGGLDSTILCSLARDHLGTLETWCAGDPASATDDADLAHARAVAHRLGTDHHEVPIDRGVFLDRWPALIESLGVPLGTPNEVAIAAVSEQVAGIAPVVLTGEGADELFAGYAAPITQIARFAADQADPRGPEDFLCEDIAWIPPTSKALVLAPDVLPATEGDEVLRASIRARLESFGPPRRAETMLRALSAVNLAGLLGRLDTATMQHSLEGRTPFADVEVATLACRVPLATHVELEEDPAAGATGGGSSGPGGVAAPPAVAMATRTKRLLRLAYADRVPAAVLERPKASFPLPFTAWLGGLAGVLRDDPVARRVLRRDAVDHVLADPAGQAMAAWPMINLALWLRRFA